MNYKEALNWIHSRSRFGINPGLIRIEHILAQVGNPHLELKVIHIGGTNGKGSTAAFTASILREAGYKTGLYTSPYLESFANRMAVDGEDVAEDILLSLAERIKSVVDNVTENTDLGAPTEFEVVTAMALLYFAETNVDYLVLEVGLGGRLDATNVIPSPLVSIITNVSLEHVDILGDTVAKIAREKAGIIKKKVPVVTASDNPKVLSLLQEVAKQHNASLYTVGKEMSYSIIKEDLKGQFFDYSGKGLNLKDLFIPLLGSHQATNATTALAALELAEIDISSINIRRGLQKTFWPGRLEIVNENPLVVIDAAHNLEGIKFLSKTLKETFPPGEKIIILGILGDKAVREVLIEILSVASRLIITKALHPTRAASPTEVAVEARKISNKPVEIVEDLKQAILTGYNWANEGTLCITGSFYTISEARRLVKEEKILKQI